MKVIENKKIYLGVSLLLVIASIVAISVIGIKQGIDFTGGTLWQLRFSEGTQRADVEKVFVSNEELSGLDIREQGPGLFLLRLTEITEEEHQDILRQLNSEIGEVEELRFETIGPAISSELRASSLKVFILVLAAISLYVISAFKKVSKEMPSWKYGLVTLVTLFHDAIISIGFFTIWGRATGAELDVSIVVAILVIMGFSVHDTIVVFDRIRENLRTEKGEATSFIINKSVKDTLARSINTSLTLILVLLAILFIGAGDLENFIMTIVVGTIVGTYSSIFVASPLLTVGKKRRK